MCIEGDFLCWLPPSSIPASTAETECCSHPAQSRDRRPHFLPCRESSKLNLADSKCNSLSERGEDREFITMVWQSCPKRGTIKLAWWAVWVNRQIWLNPPPPFCTSADRRLINTAHTFPFSSLLDWFPFFDAITGYHHMPEQGCIEFRVQSPEESRSTWEKAGLIMRWNTVRKYKRFFTGLLCCFYGAVFVLFKRLICHLFNNSSAWICCCGTRD